MCFLTTLWRGEESKNQNKKVETNSLPLECLGSCLAALPHTYPAREGQSWLTGTLSPFKPKGRGKVSGGQPDSFLIT